MLLLVAGVGTTVVLCIFPNRSREDSECDPMEDEVDIVRKMREAGFKRQVPFFMPLRVPMEEFLESSHVCVSRTYGNCCEHFQLKYSFVCLLTFSVDM